MACSRRQFFSQAAAAYAASSLLSTAQTSSKAAASKFAIPGPFRGKVIGVESPECVISGKFQPEPIQKMIRRGMSELTGAKDWQDAWKFFFEPGDVVGIKVNPVGAPLVYSSEPVLREIINGLTTAGLKPEDIVVYDRYKDQFTKVGYTSWLPPKVRWMSAAADWEAIQPLTDGYDPEHFVEMQLVSPAQTNPDAKRSHAAKFITQHVNKLINVPVLKHHQAAGVTLALKNLSHGLVNNVNRTHWDETMNAINVFTPTVVSMPVIRNKTVLHILDGTLGLYHGGPSGKPQFVWEHKTMYFATDPVAMDHVGWQVIDEKRVASGMKLIVETKPDQFSRWIHMQPEHIEIAGGLGLGEWDLNKIQVKRVKV
jgi:hypothetical protein